MQLVPLLDIPMGSFFRTLDVNSATLYDLRGTARRTDGFFMVRNTSDLHIADTFALTGGKNFVGTWYLGRIRKQPVGYFDYTVEIYRRCRLQEIAGEGTVLSSDALDSNDLVLNLRELAKGSLDFSYTSKWDVKKSSTFTQLGFDIV